MVIQKLYLHNILKDGLNTFVSLVTLVVFSFRSSRGGANSGRPTGSLRYPLPPSAYHVVYLDPISEI